MRRGTVQNNVIFNMKQVIPGGLFVGVISKCVASGSETVGVNNNVAAGVASFGESSK